MPTDIQEEVIASQDPLAVFTLNRKAQYGMVTLRPLITEDKFKPSTTEVLHASFRRYNDIALTSQVVSRNLNPEPPEENYTLKEEDFSGIQPRDYPRLLQARSTTALTRIRNDIFKDYEDEKVLERGGWTGTFTSFAAGAISPLNFLPIVAAYKGGNFGKNIMQNIVRSAPEAAVGAIAYAGIQSLADKTRSVEEDILEGATMALVGATLGGALKTAGVAVERKMVKRMQDEIKRNLSDIEVTLVPDPKTQSISVRYTPTDDSASAKKVLQEITTTEAVGLANSKINEIFKATPIGAGIFSESDVIRKVTNSVLEHNILIEGAPLPHARLESAVNVWRNIGYSSARDMYFSWLERLGIDLNSPLKAIQVAFKKLTDQGTYITYEQHVTEIAKAMRVGDVSNNTQVGKIANQLRSQLIQPLYDAAISLEKAKPGTPKTAPSYLTRLHDKERIAMDREGYSAAVANAMEKNNALLSSFYEQYEKFKQKSQAKVGNVKEQLKALKLQQAKYVKGSPERKQINAKIKQLKHALQKEKLVVGKYNEQIFQKVINMGGDAKQRLPLLIESQNKEGYIKFFKPEDRTEYFELIAKEHTLRLLDLDPDEFKYDAINSIFGKRGGDLTPSQLNKRTLMVLDSDIEDWLVNDVERIINSYALNMGTFTTVENYKSLYGIQEDLHTYFGKEIRLEQQKRLEALDNTLIGKPKNQVEKARLKLTNKFKKEQEQLNLTLDLFYRRVKPRNTIPNRVINALQLWNVSTMLGSAAVIGTTDLFQLTYKFGIADTIEKGILPFFKDFKAYGLKKQDIAVLNVAFNEFNSSLSKGLYLGDNSYFKKTFVEEGVAKIANMTGNVNLTNYQQNLFQTIGATLSEYRITQALEAATLGKATTKQLDLLNAVSINPDVWGKRILKQINDIGYMKDDVRITNYMAWEDIAARNEYMAAVRSSVNGMFYGARVAEKPAILRQEPWLSAIFQFWSWSFASLTNLTLPLMQRPDAEKLQGLLGMLLVGAFVGAGRQVIAGEPVELDMESLIREAIFNSGIASPYTDAYARLGSVFDLPYSKIDRFRNLSTAQALLGGLTGNFDSLTGALQALARGEMNQRDAKRMAKTFPWMNSILIKKQVNDAIKQLGLPETRAQARALNQ